MDSDQELETLITAIEMAHYVHRLEDEGRTSPDPVTRPADIDEEPIFRRRRIAIPDDPGPGPEPARPSGRRMHAAALAAALLCIAATSFGVSVVLSPGTSPPVGSTPETSFHPRVADGIPVTPSAVTRVVTELPKFDGAELHRTMGDVELDLLEDELRDDLRRNGYDVQEAGPARGEGEDRRGREDDARSMLVRFAKGTGGGSR